MSSIPEIDADELALRLAGGAFLLDVREPAEYSEAHVPGAVLVPLGELAGRVDEMPDDAAELMVICRSGARSLRAAELLATTGRGAVNVAGGTLGWIESGREVVAGPERG